MLLTRLAAGTAVGVLTVSVLTGCIGGSDDDGPESSDDCAPADEAMSTAKERLDETSGADFSLATNDEIEGTGIVTASVTVVRPDSFEGEFTAQTPFGSGSGEAVGIGEDVWVMATPLFREWTEVDPSEFNLPDINALLAEDGLSSLLVGTEDLGDGEAQRDENDSSKVLCYYTGTLASDQIAAVIPSAVGEDFTVEYAVDADGALRKATVTGDVYDTGTDLTYVLDVLAYDVEADIQPPA